MQSELTVDFSRKCVRPYLVLVGGSSPLLAYIAWYLTASPLFLPNSKIAISTISIAIVSLVLNFCIATFQCISRRDLLGLFGTFSLLVLSALIATHVALVPLVAWDALGGEWGVHSYAEQAVRIVSPEFGGEAPRSPRHPPLMPYMLMSVHTITTLSEYKISAGVVAWLVVCGLPISFFYSLELSYKRLALAPFLSILCLATPLLENHLSLVGYQEVFVWGLTQILVLILFLRTRSAKEKNFHTMLQALFVTTLLFFTKSLASLFVASAWSAYVLSATNLRRIKIFFIGIFITTVLITITLGAHGWRYVIPLITGEDGAISAQFSGRLSQMSLTNSLVTLEAMALGLFINGSFSILPLVTVLILVFSFASMALPRSEKYLALLIVFNVVAFTLAGSSDYIANNSGWGNDTLLSRSMLPCLAIAPLVILHAATRLQAHALHR